MDSAPLETLHAALAPVTVISGAGLLVSMLSQRYARVTDRIRSHLKELPELQKKDPRMGELQTREIRILFKRSISIRNQLIFLGFSIFCIVLTVLGIYFQQIWGSLWAPFIHLSFLLALISLTLALVLFLHDIRISLRGLQMRMEAQLQSPTPPSKLTAASGESDSSGKI